jgi:hypothetical protein
VFGGAIVNWSSWGLWGFAATVILTTIMAGSQWLGLTRMNMPFMLGTMVTPSRDRAELVGFGIQLFNGWVFSLVYVWAFHEWGGATWWRGALIGLVHGALVLTTVVRLLPAIHPRMASVRHGPTVVRQLEPPGFLALNYGVSTPVWMLLAHIVFGLVLGAFYTA